MDAWINEIVEAAGIGRVELNFRLSDMSVLVPDARILWVVAAVVAFCVVAGCHEAWFNDGQGRESDPHRK